MAKTEKQLIESHDVVLNMKANQQKKYLSIAQKSKTYNDQKGFITHFARCSRLDIHTNCELKN